MCRQPVTMFIRNIFASKVLAPLKCECRACGSEFTLDLAKEHAKTCTEIEIGCSLCAEQIKRANELAHSQVCPMRRVTCECGQVVTRREQKRHKESVRIYQNWLSFKMWTRSGKVCSLRSVLLCILPEIRLLSEHLAFSARIEFFFRK